MQLNPRTRGWSPFFGDDLFRRACGGRWTGLLTPIGPRGVPLSMWEDLEGWSLDSTTPLTLLQVDQDHQSKATPTAKEPVDEMISAAKSDWSMEQRPIFYDVLGVRLFIRASAPYFVCFTGKEADTKDSCTNPEQQEQTKRLSRGVSRDEYGNSKRRILPIFLSSNLLVELKHGFFLFCKN